MGPVSGEVRPEFTDKTGRTRMSAHHGTFGWCELMTTDVAAATEFYRAAIGWSAKEAGIAGRHYIVLSAGEVSVAGAMEIPQATREAGMRPGWIGYIMVDDVDEIAMRLREGGGTIHRPAEDIPGVGRFAVVSDPQGAVFTLFMPRGMETPPAADTSAPGHVGWHELYATDWPAAFAFYSGLFGWTKGDAVDMGPMGTYQLFATGGPAVGGMMNAMESVPHPVWNHYFNVDAIDAGVDRVKNAGGEVLNGPHEVPGGMWIAHCRDPQGASFAILSSRR